MGSLPSLRRVVTGLDDSGRSTVWIDGPAPSVIWSSPDTPARNDGDADQGDPAFGFPEAGVNFVWVEIAPGEGTDMHATNTTDFLVVLAGKVTLVTETGETVLGPGDALVDRGVVHAWRNDGDETCRIAGALVAARALLANGRSG